MAQEQLAVLLVSVLVVGVATQWVAWRFHLPPILLMLAGGLVAGPATGWLDPDAILGDLLQPLVSLGVAVILFEGGMTLRLREVRGVGRPVFLLVSVGVAVTWAIAAAAAHLVSGIDLRVALLLGAILTVSGPTVVGPLLNHIRPQGAVASLLKWEGIVIDPIGALLAILVFLGIHAAGPEEAIAVVLAAIAKGVFIGTLAGVLGALILLVALKRYWIPDFLQNAFALALVLGAFLLANTAQQEAGLVSVTVMGMVIANQTKVSVRPIVEFKETLRVLIIPALFILLTARITLADIHFIGLNDLLFLAIIIFLARPLSVFLSTLRANLSIREKVFVAGLMPRGIVAASIASVVAIDMQEVGVPGAEALVPLTFLVIVGTVLVYSIAGGPLARMLGLSREGTGGALIIGAGPFARRLGRALVDQGAEVLLVDTNRGNVTEANVAGLDARHLDALSETADERLEVERIDHVLAVTPNDRVNQLATMRYAEHVGRAEVFRLPAASKGAADTGWTGGRILFSEEATWADLNSRISTGHYIVRTRLTEVFTFADWKAHHGPHALPLALVGIDGRIDIYAIDIRPEPMPGDTLLGLVPADGEPEEKVEKVAGEGLAEMIDESERPPLS